MAETLTPRRIDGGCHCGNVRFTFHWPGEGQVIPTRKCGCSFCTKHGGVWTSHSDGRLEVSVADPSAVEPYRFGTATVDFHVCRACGVVPYVTSAIEGGLYAVVNVNCFENVDPADLEQSPADFDGEAPGDRLTRRQRNWIKNVITIRN